VRLTDAPLLTSKNPAASPQLRLFVAHLSLLDFLPPGSQQQAGWTVGF